MHITNELAIGRVKTPAVSLTLKAKPGSVSAHRFVVAIVDSQGGPHWPCS